jgi:GTP diphosphokinase / guanosine-3',5'-bis(diphosphate) 3'-diphosphatase
MICGDEHTGIPSTARLLMALAFAAEKHRHQRRKDAAASPYINHPIAVANVLAIEGCVTDEAILLAACLHDTVEDTQTTFEELEETFGTEVSHLVRDVTDDKSLEKALRKQLQIEHAAKSSDKVKQIKIADKICNVRDIINCPPHDWSSQRRTEYMDWAQKVVSGCSLSLTLFFPSLMRRKGSIDRYARARTAKTRKPLFREAIASGRGKPLDVSPRGWSLNCSERWTICSCESEAGGFRGIGS